MVGRGEAICSPIMGVKGAFLIPQCPQRQKKGRKESEFLRFGPKDQAGRKRRKRVNGGRERVPFPPVSRSTTFFAYWHISYVRTEMNGPAVTGFLDGSLNAMRGRK